MVAEFTDAMSFFKMVSEVYDKVIWPFGDLGMNESGDYVVCKKNPSVWNVGFTFQSIHAFMYTYGKY